MLNRPNREDDASGRIPLYLQIAAVLRHRIEAGHWRANEKISTLEHLEQEFGVSRITVRQAVNMLQREGLVQRIQGKGTFVVADRPQTRWLRLDSKWPSLIATIGANAPRFLTVTEHCAAPELPFDIARPGAAYTYLKSVQSRAGVPFVLASLYIEQTIFESAREAFLSHVALAVIDGLKGVHLGDARQTFVIGAADMEVAQHLDIAVGAPTAQSRLCVTNEEGVAIVVGEAIYRGDCVHIDIDLLG